MTGLKVLVNGASIAGPTFAYWLLQAGHADITIVERAPSLRLNGQSIDIRNSAVNIMQEMGIEAAVRAKTTKEAGMVFVNRKGKEVALMAATGETDRQSFTSEYEIFRGDLGEIVYDLVKDQVTTIFDEYVTMMRQDDDGVYVEFANGTKPQKYDVVIGADGLGSKTRAMAFNTSIREHLRPLYSYLAFYTMPEDMLDGSNVATWYNAPGGRMMLLRPDPTRVTRANLGVIFPKNAEGRAGLDRLLAADKAGTQALKDELARIFKGCGYEETRVLKGLAETDDLYASELAQIHVDELSRGRVALVGDSGYCPTAFTGMGTSLAMIGAYILAGELGKNPGNVPAALKAYSDIMNPYARSVQTLAPFTPRPLNPQTQWGINLRNFIIWFFLAIKINILFSVIGRFQTAFSSEKFKLPEYKWKSKQ